MSRDIWICSDWHFNHANMLVWENGRPEFSSLEEMNETMINNHNSLVKDGDIVYFLGDAFFGNKEDFGPIINRMKGKKRIIFGNHDDPHFLVKGGWFSKSGIWRIMPEFGIVMSHVPLHKGSFHNETRKLINVHGHVHRNSLDDPHYRNVCVELTNYSPVNIEEVRYNHVED